MHDKQLDALWRAANVIVDQDILEDAARFRWLLDGHGYFLEEVMLCGHKGTPEEEKAEARERIDAAMRG